MNEKDFIHLLKQLEDTDWQTVIEGRSVLMIDDLGLQTGPSNAPNAIICAPEKARSDVATLKRESIEDASSLLSNYYRTHPLTLTGFNHQAQQLITEHGATAFAAPDGKLPERTLFVDGGEVKAEPPESPRHRYGVYCELPRSLTDKVVETHIQKWLQQGEAYERYLGMNVCRYNC